MNQVHISCLVQVFRCVLREKQHKFQCHFLWSSLKTDQSVWDQVKVNCIAHSKPPELRKVLHRQPLIKQKHFKKPFNSAFNSELLLISLFLSLYLVILTIIWLAETNALQWVWTSTRSDKYSSASPFRMQSEGIRLLPWSKMVDCITGKSLPSLPLTTSWKQHQRKIRFFLTLYTILTSSMELKGFPAPSWMAARICCSLWSRWLM